VEATKLLNFANYHLGIHKKIKIPLSLFQTFTTYHPSVFTLTPFLSEGRAGIAWEPSKSMILFLPSTNKVSFISYPYFPFASTRLLPFLTLSLSVGFKGLSTVRSVVLEIKHADGQTHGHDLPCRPLLCTLCEKNS
jgi:hypothetical protein